MLPLRRGLAQQVHVMNSDEGVLVYCVAVIRIAHDQCIDTMKLRDQHLEHAKGMHTPQRMRSMRPEQDFTQNVP